MNFEEKKERSLFPYWKLPKNKELIKNAKKLRKGGVLSEVLLWNAYKSCAEFPYDLDRQVIIGNYIVDFFIPEIGVIIEIDGSTHDFKLEYDHSRNLYFNNLGLEIIHIKDIDVKKNIDGVLKYIELKIVERELCLKSNLNDSKNQPGL